VCFLATASEPLVALFAPLAVLRALVLRRRKEQTAAAGVVLGLVYQGAARLVSGGKPFTPAALHGVGQDYAERSGLALLGGLRGSDWLIGRSTAAALAVGALIVCGVVAAGLSSPSRGARAFTVAAAAASVVSFVVPVWLRGVSAVLKASPLGQASRYEAVPLLLLISIALVVAGHLSGPGPVLGAHRAAPSRPRWSTRKRAAVPVACAVLLLPAWVADFRDANQRSAGPTWPSQLALAAAHCRAGHAGTVTVRIDPPGWKAVLPCRDIK
jgi:hypothetical protein